MAKWVTAVTGRLGIIFIVIGLFLIIRRFLNFHGAISRLLDVTLSTYLGTGLLITGAIILAIFIYTFFEAEKRRKPLAKPHLNRVTKPRGGTALKNTVVCGQLPVDTLELLIFGCLFCSLWGWDT